jgi:hypothetical protein
VRRDRRGDRRHAGAKQSGTGDQYTRCHDEILQESDGATRR